MSEDTSATADLIALTTDIVTAHISNNNIAVAELPALIKTIHDALNGVGKAPAEPTQARPKAAASIRASIKPDGLISMIDGRKYQTLRRHIVRHGYTPESYREAFGLPHDYPLVSAEYSERRRAMAKEIGLGRRTKAPISAPVAEAPAKATPTPKASSRRTLKVAGPK